MQTSDRRPPRRFSYANVTSTLALFLAVAGGTALAASLPKDSVRSKHVKNNALKSVDLKDGKAVTDADVVDGSLTGADVAADSLGGSDIAPDSLTGADIVESTLGQVPTARQGGLGRYGFTGSCDPETETFIACSVVQVPLASPARILVIGSVRATTESDSDNALGSCRIGTTSGPVLASQQFMIVRDEDESGQDDEIATIMAVTSPFGGGTPAVGIDCNQSSQGGAIQYTQARVTAVALSAD